MKSVLLNEQGYTTDGDWRLVKVEPTNNGSGSMADEGAMVLKCHPDTPAMNNRTAIARAVFKAMIAASPAPVLGGAAPAATDNRIAELEVENHALQGEQDEWKQAAQTAAFTVEVLSAELAELREKPSKQQIENLAGEIAVNVAKNCASVPQLTFPYIYLGLLDFFGLSSKSFAESDAAIDAAKEVDRG